LLKKVCRFISLISVKIKLYKGNIVFKRLNILRCLDALTLGKCSSFHLSVASPKVNFLVSSEHGFLLYPNRASSWSCTFLYLYVPVSQLFYFLYLGKLHTTVFVSFCPSFIDTACALFIFIKNHIFCKLKFIKKCDRI